jgi:mRNA interferase YafQ
MKYRIFTTKGFRSSYKRLSRHKYFDAVLVSKIIDQLAAEKVLPPRYKDHQLTGSFKNYRECHIKNDLLLMYQIQDDVLILSQVDIGTHSSLFG